MPLRTGVRLEATHVRLEATHVRLEATHVRLEATHGCRSGRLPGLFDTACGHRCIAHLPKVG